MAAAVAHARSADTCIVLGGFREGAGLVITCYYLDTSLRIPLNFNSLGDFKV